MKKTITTITLASIISCFCVSTISSTAYAERMSAADAGSIVGGLISISTKTASYHHVKNLSNLDRMFITAVSQKDYATIQDMINNNVDINGVFAIAYNGKTSFSIACHTNDRTMMQFLLEKKCDVTGYYDYQLNHISYLVQATERQDLELIKYLHNWGADINEYNDEAGYGKINALHALAHCTYLTNVSVDIVNYLIDQGIDINQVDRNNSTALMRFCHKPNINMQIIRALLDAGANVNIKDKQGNTAIAYALDSKNLDIASELRTRGGK